MTLRGKLLRWVLPAFGVLLLSELLFTHAYMKSVRLEEIPFGLSETKRDAVHGAAAHGHSGIHAVSKLEQSRGFLHLFNPTYIVCFFAAKGKWPFIPPFMQTRVDTAAKTIFSKNDSSIRQFCNKWMQIKECFRPIFALPTTLSDIEVDAKRSKLCNCAQESVVYFDKNYVGNVSSETILNTIEFLESFLPPPTKKTKRKNKVRGRIDEMDIDD